MWRELTAAVLMLTACGKEIDTIYSELPARFVMTNITQCPPLQHAVLNMGQWCTVKGGNNVYIVTGLSSTVQMNLTAMTGYQGFYLGISGLIIGLPNIPEVGRDTPVVTCYDLACPNCYRDDYVGRALTIDFAAGTALCKRCNRQYNLNNQGIVTTDGGGRPLERYRATCNGQSLTVSN